ncbi:hypothetical protein ACFZB9_17340 [Kitasatospora sp. NPDC008050]|uniref:hypothetical protein n=1 Tax=Kitasatospora sp. NPDC008050 TaxID=3364021 RepID=UPI0036F18AB5
MDIVSAGTITEAITAAAGAAGTAVGRQAWEALLTVARRVRHRGAVEPAAGESATAELAPVVPLPVDPASEPQVRELITTLVEHQRQDPGLAADLAGWAREHAAALHVTVHYDRSEDHSSVSNVVSGNARVAKLIQGRDFNGTINF